nr:hypothetical protein [uncultured Moellerella sp.]
MSGKIFMGYHPNMGTQRIGQTYLERTNGGIALTPRSQNRNLPLWPSIKSENINNRNIFTYNLGDGNKIIRRVNRLNVTSQDAIRFGDGISIENLSFHKHGDYNLKINIQSIDKTSGKITTASIISPGFFYSTKVLLFKSSFNRIEVGGYILKTSELRLDKNNEFKSLYWSSDILSPQKINGNNAYIYKAGDGHKFTPSWAYSPHSKQNTLTFGEGISYEDLSFKRDDTDLKISINGTDSGSLTFINFFNKSGFRGAPLLFKQIDVAGHTMLTSDLKSNMLANKPLEWSSIISTEISATKTHPIVTDISPEIIPEIEPNNKTDADQLINFVSVFSKENESGCHLHANDSLNTNMINGIACYPSTKDIYTF